jgi:hypothetical protein
VRLFLRKRMTLHGLLAVFARSDLHRLKAI